MTHWWRAYRDDWSDQHAWGSLTGEQRRKVAVALLAIGVAPEDAYETWVALRHQDTPTTVEGCMRLVAKAVEETRSER